MTGVLTVALDPAAPPTSQLQHTVLGSLPARFRIASDTADVTLISGDQPGWHDRARSAIRAGTSAIMLAGLTALSADAAAMLVKEASAAGVTVAVAVPLAADPGWTVVLPLIAADLAASAILDSVTTVPAPSDGSPTAHRAALRSALVGQLATVRPLLPDAAGLTAAHASDGSYILADATEQLSITLSGTVSGTGDRCLRLDATGSDRHWRVTLRADALASPAQISVSTPDGEHARPPVYESGYRAAWIALHEAIRLGTMPGYTADQLARDLAFAEAALGEGTVS